MTVPPFRNEHFDEGLAVHFRCQSPDVQGDLRRMFALGSQHPPQVEKTWTIQSQLLNRSSSARSLAEHPREIDAPGEVFGPVVPPRMKERDELAAERIRRFSAGMLVPVAALAGKGKVRQVVRTSTITRQDVLYGERIGRKGLPAEAVLAAPGCTFRYRGLVSGRKAGFRHRTRVRCPSWPSAPAGGPGEVSRARPGIRSGGRWPARLGRSG